MMMMSLLTVTFVYMTCVGVRYSSSSSSVHREQNGKALGHALSDSGMFFIDDPLDNRIEGSADNDHFSGKGEDDEDADNFQGSGHSILDKDDDEEGSGYSSTSTTTMKPHKKEKITKKPVIVTEATKVVYAHPNRILDNFNPEKIETTTRFNVISSSPKSHMPTYDDGNELGNDVSILGQKQDDRSAPFFLPPGILAAVIGGAVVGLLCAILLVMFIVYRMRKKDEGSYTLDESKNRTSANTYARGSSKEFYA